MKRIAILVIATAALCAPALADEVGVRVGPIGAGVTVGSGPDRVVREREVIREHDRRPVEEKVIIQKERDPVVVEKKTIIER